MPLKERTHPLAPLAALWTHHGDLTVEEEHVRVDGEGQIAACIYNIVTLPADDYTVVDTSLIVVYE